MDIPDAQPPDPELFMRLYATHQRRLYGFVRTLVRSTTDAEDLVQQTIAVLWRKFDQYTPGTDFGSWAIATARYECFHELRKRSRRAGSLDADVLEQLADEAAALSEQAVERREALEHCLRELPGEMRQMLRMHYEHELNVNEVARRVSRSRRTVYRMLEQAHALLLGCIRRRISS